MVLATRSSALRQQALAYYHKPVDQHWHARVADAAIATNGQPCRLSD